MADELRKTYTGGRFAFEFDDKTPAGFVSGTDGGPRDPPLPPAAPRLQGTSSDRSTQFRTTTPAALELQATPLRFR